MRNCMWMPREDEMLRSFAQGWIDLNFLERRLRRSRRAIANRARELGIMLPNHRQTKKRESHPRQRQNVEEPQPQDQANYECTTGFEDPLLKRLRKHHASRERK